MKDKALLEIVRSDGIDYDAVQYAQFFGERVTSNGEHVVVPTLTIMYYKRKSNGEFHKHKSSKTINYRPRYCDICGKELSYEDD